ncbi:hypothetical protein [Rhizobium freirei]|nr:hypothetical protein [Rhizobium freirei]
MVTVESINLRPHRCLFVRTWGESAKRLLRRAENLPLGEAL